MIDSNSYTKLKIDCARISTKLWNIPHYYVVEENNGSIKILRQLTRQKNCDDISLFERADGTFEREGLLFEEVGNIIDPQTKTACNISYALKSDYLLKNKYGKVNKTMPTYNTCIDITGETVVEIYENQ